MATAQHSAAGRSPLAPGHWSRKGRGGREEDLCAEPEESRAGCREAGGGVQRVWFWSVPRVRRTGPNMVSRNEGLKKPVLTQSGQAACQGLQGAILWGRCHQLSWIWV